MAFLVADRRRFARQQSWGLTRSVGLANQRLKAMTLNR
jgi:hypothetical protein